VHEIKFDGYRAQLHKRDAGTQMFCGDHRRSSGGSVD
jgi:hypothetical protein